MKFNHEKLDVYKLAMDLVQRIYKIVKNFPKEEIYGLSSQLKRSAISIVLNISEGSGKYSKKDFARFVRNSVGSVLETDAGLKVGIGLKFLTEADYKNNFSELIKELYFKLIALHKSLSRQFKQLKQGREVIDITN